MSGGARKATVVLPTIITIAAIALAGTLILQQRQERSERLAEAEKVGSAYFSDVSTFEARVQADLAKVETGEPEDLKRVVDDSLKDPPVLGPAPDGAEDSKTYRAAVKASATVLDPFKKLSRELGRAANAQEFVEAAEDVLSNGPLVLLGSSLVLDVEPLRTRVLPRLNRALAEFRAVKVPAGGRDVAVKVEAALLYVIDQVKRMAASAESGSSYEFSYDTQYNAARQAVRDFATEINGDVAEALDRIKGAKPT